MTDTKTQANSTKRVPAIKATVVRNDKDRAVALHLAFQGGTELALTADKLTQDILNEAVWHGLKQKLVDAAAISRDPETGRSATVADKMAAVTRVYDRLLSGMWNEPREGGGSGSLLFKALCRLNPAKSPEALREWLDGKTDEQKAALRKNPKIAAEIVAIQAEQVSDEAQAAAEEALAELDDLADAE
jgi:hypothetical protein